MTISSAQTEKGKTMNKDEKAWTAMMIPASELEHDELVGNAVKKMTEKLALSLLDKLSDGTEYAVKMISPQTIPNIERGPAEIRTAMSVREIVRCKECIHHYTADCPLHFEFNPIDDWFCADGERR